MCFVYRLFLTRRRSQYKSERTIGHRVHNYISVAHPKVTGSSSGSEGRVLPDRKGRKTYINTQYTHTDRQPVDSKLKVTGFLSWVSGTPIV